MKSVVSTLAALALLVLGLALCRGEPVDLLVLETADVHAAVGTPVLPQEGDARRLATTLRRLRRTHGPDRTLVVDCGDTCQGSFAARMTGGRIGLAVLAELAPDVWVPGNHDLDFGADTLLEWIQSRHLPILCGNLAILRAGQRHAFPAWRGFERAGARVVVIGATASYMSKWLGEEGSRQMQVESAAAVLDRVLPEILQGQPDLLILATHQGWLESDPRAVNEVHDIALRYPEIDLILGAHTHRPHPGLRIGPATWYVQPGALATHLAAVHVRVDTATHHILDLTSELVPADAVPDAEVSPELTAMVTEIEAAAGQAVCQLPREIPASGTPGISCPASELICRALAEATGAAVVLHGTLGQAGLPAGPISERQLFALVPYENSIVVADLTPAELEDVVAEQIANRASYVYSGVWGAEVAIQPRTLERDAHVRLTRLQGNAGPFPERIRVAMNSHTAAGGGGRFPRLFEILRTPQAHRHNTGVNSREAVRTYLRQHAAEPLEVHRWISGTLSALAPPEPAPAVP
jgi:2',3'-cyclic-nucleotide 2'-phosphodiesterase (5'-nucleotidase family)